MPVASSAPTTCGRMPRALCRAAAPSASCRKTQTGRSQRQPVQGRSAGIVHQSADRALQLSDVNSAMATVVEKKSCARQACAMLTGFGSMKMTVMPPSTPCSDHRGERDPAETAQPAAALGAHQPDRQADREKADGGGHHAVAVLIKDAALHGRHQLAIGERPIGHREARVITGDEASGHHQKQRAKGPQHRIAVQPDTCSSR